MLVEFKFKEQLAKIKKEQSLTISQIADGIGVSSRTVDYYLFGDKKPSITTLIKLADFLNCSLDYLVGRTVDK